MTAMHRRALWRMTSVDADCGVTKYGHPNGWTITKSIRDWDARGYSSHSGDAASQPKVTWEVKRLRSSNRSVVETFRTLREARAWCDERLRWEYDYR